MRRKIPTGRVFHRSYLDRKGVRRKTRTWFLKYYLNGEPIEVPTGTEDFDEAVRMLRQRMAKVARHAEYSDHPERVLVDQLLDLIIDDYRFERRRSTYDTERRVDKHLRPFFGPKKAADISTSLIKKYIVVRQRDAEPATINKELAYLRRAFHLGMQQEPQLVDKTPHIRMLPVDNTRTGTLKHEDYRSIRDLLPPYARIALVIGYHTGARKGEIRKIRIADINLRASRIELLGKVTKNKKPRFLPIYGDMQAEIEMAIAAANTKCPFLIQRDGGPVFDWEKSWKTAASLAGIDNALFHDLRRTALSNMIEAGFSEKEAMEISGHKTRAVFDRYHIVSERRLKQLGQRLEEHLKAKEAEVLGSDTGVRQNARVH